MNYLAPLFLSSLSSLIESTIKDGIIKPTMHPNGKANPPREVARAL